MRYGNSTMTTYYDGLQGQEQEPCIVIFREDALIIEYNRDGKPRSYRGTLVDGQYQLSYWPEVESFQGTATLSASEEGLMDGNWVEKYPDGSYSGQWEIELRE